MAFYSISEEALKDIDNIWLYTVENWSVEQADRYYNLILNEIEYISENFESGRSFEHIRKGYRYSKVKSHLIFYKKSSEGVEIIRVLHQKMDIVNRLND
ncbi:type II toxin-antitoxin system RelE/ParE family toxin [Bacteroides sp. 519]|uniref:type II toxin-antitoxin system RelE/ParE family toxin n=1 Tax=Bacteroides sp. 519 TaxID=2302937 RepID=UPI0013D340BD|nr:type II toxin-antitoxin system RelE/ParE family toxin [Bacteroides sp. 519]NDV58729.1 type II toxin-antitoxin system RelE/ParE family toxin [Bacteroides sp. 519]